MTDGSDIRLGVIIPAAGASSRFGNRSKLDEDLGGRPVLQRAVELFVNREETAAIVVAAPVEGFEEFKLRHGDKLGFLGARLVKGGKTHRWESVRNALAEIPDDCTHIAVHDAARPATPSEVIDRVLDAARRHGAVIPAVPIPDTVKRVSTETVADDEPDPLAAILGDAGRANRGGVRAVEATVEREGMMLAQTPQVFRAELLRRAYEQDDLSSTDDAGLVERLGERVVVVEGDARNVKITTPGDVPLVRAVLGVKAPEGRPVHKRF